MLLKKLLFSLGHKILKAVVAVEGGHEFREIIRVLESKRNRREGRTSEGIGDLIEIAPRLGVKTAAIGVEDADNRPQVTTKLGLLTDLGAKEAIHNAGSGDNFSRSPFEHSPCNDSNLRPQLQRSFLYAAHSDIADAIRPDSLQVYDDHNLLGTDGRPSGDRATCGRLVTIPAASRSMMLMISLVAALRTTVTLSSERVDFKVCWTPLAIIKTAVKTNTR